MMFFLVCFELVLLLVALVYIYAYRKNWRLEEARADRNAGLIQVYMKDQDGAILEKRRLETAMFQLRQERNELKHRLRSSIAALLKFQRLGRAHDELLLRLRTNVAVYARHALMGFFPKSPARFSDMRRGKANQRAVAAVAAAIEGELK